jgi:hypothetical protein
MRYFSDIVQYKVVLVNTLDDVHALVAYLMEYNSIRVTNFEVHWAPKFKQFLLQTQRVSICLWIQIP